LKPGQRGNKRFSSLLAGRSLRGGGLYRNLIRVYEQLQHIRLLVGRFAPDVSRRTDAGIAESVDSDAVATAPRASPVTRR